MFLVLLNGTLFFNLHPRWIAWNMGPYNSPICNIDFENFMKVLKIRGHAVKDEIFGRMKE